MNRALKMALLLALAANQGAALGQDALEAARALVGEYHGSWTLYGVDTNGLVVKKNAWTDTMVAKDPIVNILSKTTTPWSSGFTYLLWSDGKALPQSREIKLSGKDSGTQAGQDKECTSLMKVCCLAPASSSWKPGRQVAKSNLPRGTAIAIFKNGVYALHAGILAGMRSDGSFDLWDQNWQLGDVPSIIRRHTISGTTGGGISDRNAYYEVIT